jgi:hypothetical protein
LGGSLKFNVSVGYLFMIYLFCRPGTRVLQPLLERKVSQGRSNMRQLRDEQCSNMVRNKMARGYSSE